MKRIIYCILLICLFPLVSWAQDSDEDEEYQTEFLYGINFNTNGGLIGGIVLRYSTVIDDKTKQTFGLEIVNVKHPKEIRAQSATNGNTYIFGKSNYLFAIRPQYGREIILFRKAPEEGVRISAIGAIGPSFGIVKPYFVAISDASGNVTIEQFDPNNLTHSQQFILGSAAFTRLDGTKIAMGIHAKAGLSFEIGGFRTSATGFEVGGMLEAYTRKIIMIPDAENRSVFTSVYLNIFFKSKK